jgi:hypothetical protein
LACFTEFVVVPLVDAERVNVPVVLLARVNCVDLVGNGRFVNIKSDQCSVDALGIRELDVAVLQNEHRSGALISPRLELRELLRASLQPSILSLLLQIVDHED